jgi:hypothetical protein
LAGKCYLAHRDLHSITSLNKLVVEIRLIQSLLRAWTTPGVDHLT